MLILFFFFSTYLFLYSECHSSPTLLQGDNGLLFRHMIFLGTPDPLWEGWFMKREKSYEKHILVWNKKTEKGVFFASDVFVFSWYFWSCLYSSENSDDNTKNSIINNRKTYKFIFIMISSFRVPLSTKHITLITLKSLEEQKRGMRMERKQRRGGTQ